MVYFHVNGGFMKKFLYILYFIIGLSPTVCLAENGPKLKKEALESAINNFMSGLYRFDDENIILETALGLNDFYHLNTTLFLNKPLQRMFLEAGILEVNGFIQESSKQEMFEALCYYTFNISILDDTFIELFETQNQSEIPKLVTIWQSIHTTNQKKEINNALSLFLFLFTEKFIKINHIKHLDDLTLRLIEGILCSEQTLNNSLPLKQDRLIATNNVEIDEALQHLNTLIEGLYNFNDKNKILETASALHQLYTMCLDKNPQDKILNQLLLNNHLIEADGTVNPVIKEIVL